MDMNDISSMENISCESLHESYLTFFNLPRPATATTATA